MKMKKGGKTEERRGENEHEKGRGEERNRGGRREERKRERELRERGSGVQVGAGRNR